MMFQALLIPVFTRESCFGLVATATGEVRENSRRLLKRWHRSEITWRGIYLGGAKVGNSNYVRRSVSKRSSYKILSP